MSEKEEELRKVIIEAASALNSIYYTDLSEEQMRIRTKRIAVDLMEASEKGEI